MPKCAFCDQKADFRYEKKATETHPSVVPPVDYCFECYDQRVGSEFGDDFVDPIKLRDRALAVLAKKGDVPGLDFGSKSPYRWARQAGLALCVAATFSVRQAEATVVKAENVTAISKPPNSLAKLSEVRLPKGVLIMNYAPNVQSAPLSVHDVLDFGVRNVMRQEARHKSVFTWTDTRLAFGYVRRLCERISGRNAVSEDIDLDPISNIVGRSLPVIYESGFGLKSKIFVSFLINGTGDYHRQVGPQLSACGFGCLFAQGNETPGDYSKQRGRDASNAPGMSLQKLPDMNEQIHRYLVSGALFCAGIFIFLAYLCIKRSQK